MNAILLSRIIGAVVLGIVGAIFGQPIFEEIQTCLNFTANPSPGLIVAVSAAVFFLSLALLSHLV